MLKLVNAGMSPITQEMLICYEDLEENVFKFSLVPGTDEMYKKHIENTEIEPRDPEDIPHENYQAYMQFADQSKTIDEWKLVKPSLSSDYINVMEYIEDYALMDKIQRLMEDGF